MVQCLKLKLFRRSLLGFLIMLLHATAVRAQSDIDFWFAAPDLQKVHGDEPVFLRIATSKTPSEVTISMPANAGFKPIVINISADTAISVNLSSYLNQIENIAVDSVQKKGLRIQSTSRITCYYDIANNLNGDLFALKGRNALGTKFTVPFQLAFDRNPINNGYYTSDFIVLATEDSTKIEVNSPVNLNGTGKKSFSIYLNRGETYVFFTAATVSVGRPGGALVTSNKPIAISTKDDSIGYPRVGCSDTAGDQLIPDRLAGNEFILIKGYFTGSNPDYYYVFAIEDNTKVKVNGSQVDLLSKAGDYYIGRLGSSGNITDFVETDKPVQMFQISGFGCEVGGAVIPPIKCTGSKQVSITSTSSNQSFFINIISPKEIIKNFIFNGSNKYVDPSVFSLVPGTGENWYYARLPISTDLIGDGGRVLIENNLGKFHVGVIQGTSGTTRFGFFSDFSSNSVLFSNESKPGEFLLEKDTLCYNSNVKINSQVEEARDYSWVGPNNFSSKDSVIAFKNFLPKDTGVYVVTSTSGSCGTAKDSIRLIIDQPFANFNFTTNGCSGDSVVFKADSSAAVRWVWDFANGEQLDTAKQIQPKIKLSKAIDYNVKLKVASVRGCFSDDSVKVVKLSTKPKPTYKVQDIKCIDKTIQFDDASKIDTGSIVKWRWDFDTSGTFIQDTASSTHSLIYNSYGPKKVRLVAESSTGCVSDTFSISSLVVNPNPVPGFIVPEVCLNDAFAQFKDTTSSPDGNKQFSYQWYFNDGEVPIKNGPSFKSENTIEKDPKIKYNDTGYYRVKLIVTSNGCIDSVARAFTVNGANPIPFFEVNASTQLCSNDSVRIVNRSTVDFGDVTRLVVYWDEADTSKNYVDETPFVGKQYAFRYNSFQLPADKKYKITLRAYSGSAFSCSKTYTAEINLLASPKVQFDSLPGICLDGTPRQITQTGFDKNVPGSFSYAGRGVSSTGLFDPSLIGAADTVGVKYLFVAQSGCRDSASRQQVIWPRPIADFKFSNITCEKNDIEFISTSTPMVGKLVKWEWNFNDSKDLVSRNNENPFNYVFDASKNYDVGLTVTTDNGCASNPKIIPVNVHPLPQVKFDLPIVCLPEGKALFVNKTSIADATTSSLTYKWYFGNDKDTTTSSNINPVHFYKQLGAYDVKLIATSIHQCRDSITQSLVDVFPQPRAVIEGLDSVCIGTSISFNDKSDGIVKPINAWYWNFGDSTGSSSQNPTHTYRSPNVYNMNFYARSDVGCFSDTLKRTITVHAYPKIDAGPEIFALDDADTRINATATGNRLRYQWSPATYLSQLDSLQPIINRPQSDVLYQLTVTGAGNCISRDQVRMNVLRKPLIPNTFTPNGDAINDKWVIKHLEIYPDCIVEVYAPNGKLVFKNIGYDQPWDGKKDGVDLPAGTYYYVVYPKSGRKEIVGYVTLMR
jgi:gliding motility-associated-like protein